MERALTFLTGILIGSLLLFWIIIVSGATYKNGIKDTHKEAFKMGLMTKEIDKDDKVIYVWRELHDIGYE